jgi:hypothetical protein
VNQNIKVWGLLAGIGVSTLAIIYLLSRPKRKSSFKKKLIQIAEEEHKAWDEGKIKEGSQDTLPRLRKYWEEGAGVKQNDNYYINEAWSSAFISYLMRKAGAGDDFKYAQSHSQYIEQAVKNRKEKNSKKFKGYRPNEVEVKVGDLVCYPRQSGVTYDSKSGYKSHCDLIVEIKDNKAIGVGGNVGDSVTKKSFALKNGKIDKEKDNKGYGGVFVVIKNEK